MDKTEKLRKIKDEVIDLKGFLADERRKNKKFPVIGEGSHDASIMFIGEAPGKNEAEQGRPFCGAAGRILDNLLNQIGVKRKEVYVTNIVKDRPPNNRDPLPEEIALYAPFLDQQIEVISPKIIATLGRFSMEYIMKRYGLSSFLQSISRIHGNVFETEIGGKKTKVIPLYHPAVALYNAGQMKDLEKDFEVLKTEAEKDFS